MNRELIDLSTDQLVFAAYNPRQSMDPVQLQEFVGSVKASGIITPLLVRALDDKYEVIAGSRRLTAAREIGLETVPCLVADIDEAEAREIAITDNLQRADVHPAEEASAYKLLMDARPELTVSDSAKRERIGNAVPPSAAQAIADLMGKTLLLAWSGETFALSSVPIWVSPVAVALSVKTSDSEVSA